MFGKATTRDLVVAKRYRLFFHLSVVLCSSSVLSYLSPITNAAVIGSGDVNPADPSTWTFSNPGIIGESFTGTVTVDGGSSLQSGGCSLGLNPGSSGTATVTGVGSKWTNYNNLALGEYGSGTLNIEAGGQIVMGMVFLCKNAIAGSTGVATVTGAGSKWTSSSIFIGYSGSGTLNIEAGGQVSNKSDDSGYDSYVGYHGSGTTTVTGTGSKWTNSGRLFVGYSGSGTLNIQAGGEVSNAASQLGDRTGSTGAATITGAGSKWTISSALYVGNNGNGTLNIEAGGQVSDNVGYLGQFSGSTGTVTVRGVGSQWINSSSLHIGRGTLDIEAGGQVISNGGYVSDSAGFFGTATVRGVGSQWTNNGNLYVGYAGNGTLTVADGGMVSAKTILASLGALLGNGIISAKGAVLDADLVFDVAHGMQQTFAFGTGGAINLDFDGTGILGAGYRGVGTVRITDGVTVASSSSYLGYQIGSNGTTTVSGTGSQWTNNGDLNIGYSGNGTLNIEAGGQVSNANSSCVSYVGCYSGSTGNVRVAGAGSTWTNSGNLFIGISGNGTLSIAAGGQVSSSDCYLGYSITSSATAMVTGAGSTWTNSGFLYVGYGGSGTLTVNDGGTVIVEKCIFSSLKNLSGNGTILTNGSVLDADLVFDATHGLQQAIAFGTGGALNVNQDGSCVLDAGFKGNGTLRIADGIAVPSSDGYLGYFYDSTGTATVSGAGSTWTNSGILCVGYYGNGTLNIGSGDGTGGLVATKDLILAPINTNTIGICNINGGTLRAESISKGGGSANFNWYNGTIQNHDTDTNLTISKSNNLVLKLSTTGTHAFNIDAGRTGTVDAVLSDATSGGTLTKRGAGLLKLTGTNTYTGQTTISDGALQASMGTSFPTNSFLSLDGGVYQGIGTVNFTRGLGTSGSKFQWTANGGGFSALAGLITVNVGGSGVALTWGTVLGSNIVGTLKFGSSSATNVTNFQNPVNLNGANRTIHVDDNLRSSADYAVMSGTISNSSGTAGIMKTGAGSLLLPGVNTYNGTSITEAGQLKVTGSILNTSGIIVNTLATLELARSSGSATAANVPINNDGTLLISAGSQKVGSITGAGVTQVRTGASLTAISIVQDSLIIGSSGAGGHEISQVPESSTLVLLLIGALGVFAACVQAKQTFTVD